MARVNKFASVNLNDLFGKKEPAVKTAVNAPGSGARPKGTSHGMLVLTRPVKQPIKIGSASTGNLKKATSESLKPTATDTSGWTNISQIESNVGLVKDNPKPASTTDKPDVYVPPSLRGLHSASVPSASVKLDPVPVEKTAVLSGEEFPSLQASLTPANTNGQQQQTKDNQLDSKEQLEKLQHLSLQAQSRSCLNDVTEPDLNRFEPQRPQFFRPSCLRGNEQTTLEKPETVTEKPDGYLSRNPHLLGDDERANGFGNRLSSANGIKTPGSGSYSHQSPSHGSICRPELAQPNCGVIQREEQTETEILSGNRATHSPPSKGGWYEGEEFPRSGSGESRYYERETFPQPGLGESSRYYERKTFPQPGLGESSRYHERETFPQPGLGESRYSERGTFPQPGLGGSRYNKKEAFTRPSSGGSSYYEKEAFTRPGSGGSRYEREAFSRPWSGGSRYNHEAFPRPGSGGNMYEREALPRPGSGGNRYGREALSRPGSGGSRYEREVLPQPGSGGNRYEREGLPQPGSDGSRFHQEGLPRPGSGGSSYGREGLPRPGSGGNRYEREGLPQSGVEGSRFNQEGLPRPGSGGSRYEREGLPQSGVEGSRFNLEASPQLISGGSRSEREVLPRPGSGGSRFNQEVFPRPVSGGIRYGREALPRSDSSGTSYERGAFPRPGSGGSRFELEVLPQSASGGSRFEKKTLGHPSSVGGMHETEALSISGYGSYSSEYSNEREVISRAASGGGNCARPGSGGSGYGRQELILPESVDVSCTQPGFNGGGDYVQPNSGGLSYEREVVLRPGSGDNKYSRLSRPGMGGNGRIDGKELYKGSYFNGRLNDQRREAKSLMDYADGQKGNIHNAYESNREHVPFRRGGTSGELPSRDNYRGRGQAIVGSYGRDGAHVSGKW